MEWFSYADIVFREPERLFVLVLCIPLVGALFLWKYLSVQKVFADPWMRMHMPGARIPSRFRYIAVFVGTLLMLGFLAGAFSEPEQKHLETEPVYGAIRLTFILDSSRSMIFAEDVKPNRLLGGKAVVRDLIDGLSHDPELRGNYELALIPFAGAAVPLFLPFTISRHSFVDYLEAVDENTVTVAGTSIKHALYGYARLLRKFPAWDEGTVDIAILISDGGKEEGIAVSQNRIAQVLASLPESAHVYTVGVGSRATDEACVLRTRAHRPSLLADEVRSLCTRAVPVPLFKRKEDGGAEYLRMKPFDTNSRVLSSTLDEDTLQFVAEHGRGTYTFFEDREQLLAALRDIVLSSRKQTGTLLHSYYMPALKEFLVPAFVIGFFLFGFGGAFTALRRGWNTRERRRSP